MNHKLIGLAFVALAALGGCAAPMPSAGLSDVIERPAGAVNHWKLVLAGAQQRFDRMIDRGVGRQRGELRHHRGAHRDAA